MLEGVSFAKFPWKQSREWELLDQTVVNVQDVLHLIGKQDVEKLPRPNGHSYVLSYVGFSSLKQRLSTKICLV